MHKFNIRYLLVILICSGISCSSSKRASIEPEMGIYANEVEPKGSIVAQDTPAEKVIAPLRITPEMEQEIFNRYYGMYSRKYNTMINEYMAAVRHSRNGNYELARPAALRANNIQPTVQTYELLILITTRLGNMEERERWIVALEQFVTLRDEGKVLTSDGEIISIPN